MLQLCQTKLSALLLAFAFRNAIVTTLWQERKKVREWHLRKYDFP